MIHFLQNFKIPWIHAVVLGLVLSDCQALASTEIRLWVSPDAKVDGNGSQEQPYATLEQAREAIRALRKGKDAVGPVTVYLRGGIHRRTATFTLDAQDSGTSGAPVVYRSSPGERAVLDGGVGLPGRLFTAVSDPAILARLPESARDKVVQADLSGLGIVGLAEIKSHAFLRISPLRTPAPELFVHGEMMQLARWPNHDVDLGVDDYTSSDEVGSQRQPQRRWAEAKDIWLMVQKAYSRESRPIALTEIGKEGVQKSKWVGGCYYYNLLEELDQPGEYFIDRANSLLYLYPPAPMSDRAAELSVLSEPFILVQADHVELRELTISTGRDHGIILKGGSHNRVIECELRNLGKVGVVIGNEDPYWIYSDMWKQISISDGAPLKPWQNDRPEKGRDNAVIGCDIHGTGAGGIAIAGGDRATLIPSGSFAENNHIWNYHRIKGSYGPAINLGGVGHRASHNLIHGAAHGALQFNGNDHRMEYNEIFDVLNDTTDAGAIYSGREWTFRGNLFRHNFVHHLGGRGKYYKAIYLDDLVSSLEIDGNIFADLKDAAIALNGGRDNKVTNNIFANTERAINLLDYRTVPKRWGLPKSMLARTPYYKNEIWSKRYPELARILEDEPGAAKGNVIERNLFYSTKLNVPLEPYISVKDNLWLNADPAALAEARQILGKSGFSDAQIRAEVGDPMFVDPAVGDFQLLPDSPVWTRIPGFKPIPLEKIGLVREASRLQLPAFGLLAPAGEAMVDPEGLLFSWEPSPGATRYRLLVAEDPGFTNVVVDQSPRQPWWLTDNLRFGATYFWKVQACSSSRQLKAVWNSGGTGQFKTMPLSKPPAPRALRASARFQKVELGWERVQGRCRYQVHRSTHPENGFTPVSVPLEQPLHTEVVPDPSRIYYYKVKALNDAGEGEFSDSISVEVGAERTSLSTLDLSFDRELLRPGSVAVARISGVMNDGEPATAAALNGARFEISHPELLALQGGDRLVASSNLLQTASVTVKVRLGEVVTPEKTLSLVPIPAPWDIKAYGGKVAGIRVEAGRFTLESNGKAVWHESDDFLFVFQPRPAVAARGGVAIEATLLSTETSINSAAAGLMFREEHTAGSRNVFLRVEADGRIFLSWRPKPGAGTLAQECGRVEFPSTLKLVREGKTFSAWHRKAGEWVRIGSIECEMNSAAYAGMACLSTTESPMKAFFEKVSVADTRSPVGAP